MSKRGRFFDWPGQGDFGSSAESAARVAAIDAREAVKGIENIVKDVNAASEKADEALEDAKKALGDAENVLTDVNKANDKAEELLNKIEEVNHESIQYLDNDSISEIKMDAEKKVVEARDMDGEMHHYTKHVFEDGVAIGNGVGELGVANINGAVQVDMDANRRIHHYVDEEGVHHFPGGIAGMTIAGTGTAATGMTDKEWRVKTFDEYFQALKYARETYNSASNPFGLKWHERLRILHVSDVHGYTDQLKEAVELAQGRCHVICNTGDDTNGMPTDGGDSVVMNGIRATTQAVNANNVKNVKYIVAKGNHDVTFIKNATYKNVISNVMQGFIWAGTDKTYGYTDVTASDYTGTVRIVLLDAFDYAANATGEFNDSHWQTATFSQEQINWFISTLKYAATNGYHVITMMHYSWGDSDTIADEVYTYPDVRTWAQDKWMIPDIIDAAQKQTKLVKTYTDVNVTADFVSTPALKYICHLYGHTHGKFARRLVSKTTGKTYDILMIGEAALGNETQAGQPYNAMMNKVLRLRGEINNIEASALEIDTVEKCIYRVNYGAYIECNGSNVNKRVEKINYNF